ncbi:Putative serine/threonine-protein kinase-like protein CCR3 [Linum perenne]
MAVNFTSLTFLLLTTVASASTIAVIHTSPPTVCGIVSGQPTQHIKCFNRDQTTSIQPNISFQSISGDINVFCGLVSSGRSLFCWHIDESGSGYNRKRIYHNRTVPLTDLTVGGGDQICAREVKSGIVRCWHEIDLPDPDPAMSIDSVTISDVFGCGIFTKNSTVYCWGRTTLARQFGGWKMQSLVVGQFHEHACGNSKSGVMVCKGFDEWGQLGVPWNSGFEFNSLTASQDFNCAIKRRNGNLTCWGRGVDRFELNVPGVPYGESFDSVYAGLDFVCGLYKANYTVSCWGTGWTGYFGYPSVIPLGTLIPGPCVKNQSACKCGVNVNSRVLCSGSGVICESCPVLLAPPPAAVGKGKK